jgi:hypothetical protein
VIRTFSNHQVIFQKQIITILSFTYQVMRKGQPAKIKEKEAENNMFFSS